MSGHGDDYRQGKCTRCRIRFVWPAPSGPLAGAHCPKCGSPLARTTWDVRLDAEQIESPVYQPPGGAA